MLEGCQYASLGSVLLLEVKVRDGEVRDVACRLENGNQVCITPFQSAAKPSSFSNLVRACFHCTDGNPEVLEGEGMCPRLYRD